MGRRLSLHILLPIEGYEEIKYMTVKKSHLEWRIRSKSQTTYIIGN